MSESREDRSESIAALAEALAKAQGEMAGAAKASVNPYFKSRYADLASVRDACQQPLAKHGLSVAQFPSATFAGTPELHKTVSKSGEERVVVRTITIVNVTTRLMHTSGEWMDGTMSTMLPNADPQSVGSAITYLRRYGLSAMVGIAPEDDDGEATTRSNSTRSVAPDPPQSVVDVRTGDNVPATQKPEPPRGFKYLQRAWLDSGGWYHVTYPMANAEGGEVELKTRLERVGAIAMQAYQDGTPVRPHSKKPPFLDKIEVWKPSLNEDPEEWGPPPGVDDPEAARGF